MQNIIVTGGTGKAGQAAIQELVDHGYNVLNVDLTPPAKLICPFLKVDLTDMGQTIDAFEMNPDFTVRMRKLKLPTASSTRMATRGPRSRRFLTAACWRAIRRGPTSR